MNAREIADGAIRAFPARNAEGEPIAGNHTQRLQAQLMVKLTNRQMRRGR